MWKIFKVNYARENLTRFRMIPLGCGFKAKVGLFGVAVFESVPKHLRVHFKRFDSFLDLLAAW